MRKGRSLALYHLLRLHQTEQELPPASFGALVPGRGVITRYMGGMLTGVGLVFHIHTFNASPCVDKQPSARAGFHHHRWSGACSS